MNKIRLNSIFFIAFFLLIGCGGETINSAKDLEEFKAESLVEFKNIENNIVGYWTSENSLNPEYEFFASASESDFEPSVKQGKVFESGKLVGSFYWQLQDNGTIVLNLVDRFCNFRPLNSCKTVGFIKIQATGSSLSNATWNINYEDTKENNVRSFLSRYSRKNLDLSAFSQGEFVLSEHEVFDLPLAGEVNGNTVSLLADWYRTDRQKQKLSASFDVAAKKDIKFDAGKSLAFYENAEFFVDGIGYKTLQVKTWYEDVVLSASDSNRYSLRYELHREIQSPDNIDPALIHLGDFKLLIKSSKSYTLINKFIQGPTIKSMDKFFTYVFLNLSPDPSRTFNGAGGELLFTSNEDVVASLVDNIDGLTNNTARRSYTWSQSQDGTISIQLSGSQPITIHFIKAINGGYNVLYRYADGIYSRHDFIFDAASVVDENTFAGRYKFISNDGWSSVEVVFHKDKTVTSTPNIVNGHWFQDTNGDIVSFECTTLARQDVINYTQCYEDFDRLGEMAFVHIRRLGFIHKDGDNYQLKYSASFYGDIFDTTSVSKDYLSLAWTYRWVRVGNE